MDKKIHTFLPDGETGGGEIVYTDGTRALLGPGMPPGISPIKELRLAVGKAMSGFHNAVDYALHANRKFMVIHANSTRRNHLADARMWADWLKIEGMPGAEHLLLRINEADDVLAACEDSSLQLDSYAAKIERAAERLSAAMPNVHD